jgi:acyl-CoA synthetase (NDP forming)
MPQPTGAPRDLSALFDPRSVAIVGASDDTAKWGHHLARELLKVPTSRAIHLVNRRGGTVMGRPAVTSLRQVDDQVDLVAITVPASGFLDALDDALAAGARAVVAITAGMSETSDEGAALEREALRRVRDAGAVLVGPNCLGVVDTSSDLYLSSEPFSPGSVAVLSQSGNLVIDLDDLFRARGLGISRFVSLGNQADLSLAELLGSLVDHGGTTAAAVYAEDVRDGRAFVAAARAMRAAGKPVVLLAPGRTAAATRGAASHTGSLTSPTRVVDAACRAAGVHRVDTPTAMADLLQGLAGGRRASGRRVAVFTDGGGHGAVAADSTVAAGLDVPLLSDDLGARLRGVLWAQSTTSNPVDLAGVGEQDPSSYARGLAALLASDEVDAVLWVGYFGGYAIAPGSLGPREVVAAHEAAAAVVGQGKPVVVQSIFPESPSVQVLRDAGIPVHRGFAEAAAVLAGLCRESDRGPDDIALPEPAPPLAASGYVETRSMLVDAGVPFPPLAVVTHEAELFAALREGVLAFPVVLKALGLLHKSDAGGVVLGLADEAAALAAYRDLVGRLDPPAVTVEAMADLSRGVEVIVGVQQDQRFGPVAMVGLGGVFAEVFADVAFALAPVSITTATEMLLSLRGAPLLLGARGRSPVDLTALAGVVAAVSAAAAAHPELAELEVNPVLALPDGALALDARALPSSAADRQQH